MKDHNQLRALAVTRESGSRAGVLPFRVPRPRRLREVGSFGQPRSIRQSFSKTTNDCLLAGSSPHRSPRVLMSDDPARIDILSELREPKRRSAATLWTLRRKFPHGDPPILIGTQAETKNAASDCKYSAAQILTGTDLHIFYSRLRTFRSPFAKRRAGLPLSTDRPSPPPFAERFP
jgi:hypothetical protein